MINHEHYTYRVIWSEEDQEFVGLVAEFPSLSYLHEKQTAALNGIVELVEEVVADMIADGETPPEPLSEKHYSGKLLLRLTPELHQKLAIEAQEENISLNRYIIGKLITN
jgi:predicted HicB family RNase H-like nuclease